MVHDMTNHRYDGEYTSAIARCRRVLKAAGIPWSVTTGRYQPFDNQQKTTPGIRVTRVGCGWNVAVHAYGMERGPREESRQLETRALEILRKNGLPFDHRGWLECRRHRH